MFREPALLPALPDFEDRTMTPTAEEVSTCHAPRAAAETVRCPIGPTLNAEELRANVAIPRAEAEVEPERIRPRHPNDKRDLRVLVLAGGWRPLMPASL